MEPWHYRAIAAWGRHVGSQQYYIEAQQAKAAREGAPLDALYARCGGEGWVCTSDLEERYRMEVVQMLRDLDYPAPTRKGGLYDDR